MPTPMKRNRRSNVTVIVVDMEKAVREFFEDGKGEFDDAITGLFMKSSKWGYVETPRGLYVLDYEACGPGGCEVRLTEHGNKIKMPLYVETKDGEEIFPRFSFDMDANFVRGLDKLGEENFGEFVRKFGSRLETNFHNWNRFLESELGVEGQTA